MGSCSKVNLWASATPSPTPAPDRGRRLKAVDQTVGRTDIPPFLVQMKHYCAQEWLQLHRCGMFYENESQH